MARIIATLRAWVDPEDHVAMMRDLEWIARKYGPRPAPHLRAEFDAECERVMSNYVACVQFEAE